MSKNVAVFVDVANIFYAAKAAGVDIDYVTLLKSATAGRDFVRAYAYTGLDPDNENQRNFHQFLARHQYKVVSKDIRKYGDGKVKANLDIELVVDLMKTARNLDIAVIVSGDGDFASAIRAVQEMGVRVEVVSFRGNTSSDLIEVADLFTDITQIAKVDKGSTRSGRRVAEDDDEDLSMTEVPDKMTEGTGRGRGRGRGRGGRYERDEAPVAARAPRGRVTEAPVAAATGGALVALPGEKLSRAGAGAAAASVEAGDEPELDDEAAIAADGEALDGDGRRRRRRRGGRGRGRGRRDELGTVDGVESDVDADEAEDALAEAEAEDAAEADAIAASADGETAIDEDSEAVAEAPAPARGRGSRGGRTSSGEFATPFDDLDALSAPTAPRAPRSTPFGSVWDAQLGAPVRQAASGPAPVTDDDEDLEEPEIPEYLLAERRQANRGGANRGRGGGRNSAYAAAIERERYGGGRGTSAGSGINRYGETRGAPGQGRSGGGGGGGGNRSGQGGRGGSRNDRPAERYDRAPRQASPSGSAEPWSEVPPELEELLRAQMAKSRPAAPAGSERVTDAPAETAAPARRSSTRGRSSAKADTAPAAVADVAEAPAEAAPKRRTTRSTAPAAAAREASEAVAGDATEAPAPKRRTTRAKAAAPAADAPDAAVPAAGDATEAPAPKRRATRAKAPAEATTDAEAAPAAAPKRRTTRKAAPAADATPTEG